MKYKCDIWGGCVDDDTLDSYISRIFLLKTSCDRLWSFSLFFFFSLIFFSPKSLHSICYFYCIFPPTDAFILQKHFSTSNDRQILYIQRDQNNIGALQLSETFHEILFEKQNTVPSDLMSTITCRQGTVITSFATFRPFLIEFDTVATS